MNHAKKYKIEYSKIYKVKTRTTIRWLEMVLEDQGTFRVSVKGKTGLIYIPADLVKDSAFPLQDGDSLTIRIEKEILIIKKDAHGKLS